MTSKEDNISKPTGESPATEPAAAPPLIPATAELNPPSAILTFPIVGIGASAGGLAAFEAFFSGMPADVDSGMAFVLVQHLAPNHKSILTDLIRRYTRMQVFEVEDGMVVQPNCTYIIPPNYDMALGDGALQLFAPSAPRGQRLPIDFFFRSLAQDQQEQAIGIVLSGTGSDGTLGLRAIKGGGGMAMVQKAGTAEFDGMPRSALATGLVDYELPPAEMPAQLMAFAARALTPFLAKTVPESIKEDERRKILTLLRTQTGHDLSPYKPSTINRRIARRMVINQIDGIEEYIRYLRQAPQELEALFRDLLIGVTSFFRDPKAFEVLAEVAIPKLFAGRPAASPIRVWVPGCSTGEEAYSIAILLQEEQEKLKHNHPIQIFAGDIDGEALTTGRAGVYPATIAADLSPERLARFFTVEAGAGFVRIRKSIRDLMIFSAQDVTRDPPFSRLDLISCRNVLIYFNTELQKRLFPLFHYALNPDGFLFLGTSETTGNFGDLFALLNPAAKLYQRKAAPLVALGDFVPAMTAADRALTRAAKMAPVAGAGHAFPVELPLRELTEQALLQQVISAGVLVNGNGDILYLHGRTGLYLEPAQGKAGLNILKMAREGLGNALMLALHKAAATHETVCHPRLRVKTNGDFTTVNLTVRPVWEGGRPALCGDGDPSPSAAKAPVYLVILEEAPQRDQLSVSGSVSVSESSSGIAPPSPRAEDVANIAALQQALRDKDEYLQTSKEELESSNEELQSSNEEMQSINEELQSTNEELQTSQEELQSVNEELATVNVELQTKVADLSRAKNDRDNLLAGTSIGTVFVDLQLRILSFTPPAAKIINLIPPDIGRPLSHFAAELGTYSRLVADTQSVLDTLAPKEVEVQTAAGQVYMLRILPYRTLENVIEGAVITFVDITELRKASVNVVELKEAEVKLRRANRALGTINECNQLLARATDEAMLLDGVCQLLIKHGSYRMAWVGFAEQDQAKTVRPVAQDGFDAGYLETVNITWADVERGHGPTGTAIRTGQHVIARNISTDPAYGFWRAAAIQRGYASSIAVPLKSGARVMGALMVYAAQPDAFDAAEVELLTELANNASYGIGTLRERAVHKQAEDLLLRDAQVHRLFVEYSPAAIAMFDLDMKYIVVSRRYLKDYNLVEQDLVGRSHYEVFPEMPERWKEIHRRCLAGATEECAQDPFPRADGTMDWVSWTIHPWYEVAGKIGGIILFSEVITKRKAAEAALQEADRQRRLAVAVRDARDAIIMRGLDGRILAWNPAAERLYGWDEAEALTMNTRDLIPGDLHEETSPLLRQLSQDEVLEPYCTKRLTKDGRVVDVWLVATTAIDASGTPYAITTSERLIKNPTVPGGKP